MFLHLSGLRVLICVLEQRCCHVQIRAHESSKEPGPKTQPMMSDLFVFHLRAKTEPQLSQDGESITLRLEIEHAHLSSLSSE